jgi:hypothetical protein
MAALDNSAPHLLNEFHCLMNHSSYAIGQAVFIRTDTPDYSEETIPFKTLEELVTICSSPREHLTLDKIMIYSMIQDEPHAVMLGFMSASRGGGPGPLALHGDREE